MAQQGHDEDRIIITDTEHGIKSVDAHSGIELGTAVQEPSGLWTLHTPGRVTPHIGTKVDARSWLIHFSVAQLPQIDDSNPIIHRFREMNNIILAGYWIHRLSAGDIPLRVGVSTKAQIAHAIKHLSAIVQTEAEQRKSVHTQPTGS